MKKFAYSGSCFVIEKDMLSNDQIKFIMTKESVELSEWHIQESDNYLIAGSYMPEFNIVDYLVNVGIPRRAIDYAE